MRRARNVELVWLLLVALAELSDLCDHRVVAPYVVVDHRPVGNFSVIKALTRSGGLERVVRGAL